MPAYVIMMGQAAIVNNLAADSIYTGPVLGPQTEPGHALQNCSAVIMVNTLTNVGGMYHFPGGHPTAAGSAAANIITQMINAINPSYIEIRLGTRHVLLINPPPNPDGPALVAAIQAVNPALVPVVNPATKGAARVSIVAGNVVVGDQWLAQSDTKVDLAHTAAGVYGWGTML